MKLSVRFGVLYTHGDFAMHYMRHTMQQFQRNIFTEAGKPTKLEKTLDYLLAILLAVVGSIALLAYFDILTR